MQVQFEATVTVKSTQDCLWTENTGGWLSDVNTAVVHPAGMSDFDLRTERLHLKLTLAEIRNKDVYRK